ncbi:FMN-binding protein [Candidatus Cloacimonadota bacterium]
MAAEKRSFRESRIYPVIFMLVITVFFVGILAYFYNSTKLTVMQYNELILKRSILKTFDLPLDNVEKAFSKHITEIKNSGITYYQGEINREVLGYCYMISGPGLWGTIDALITLTPDLTEIINIEIVKHNETPGLGSRISEDWFKEQFKGKLVLVNDNVQTFQLVSEDEIETAGQIRQVTGATFSSKAVVDMIVKEMKKIKETSN